ncbi:hypothetical protein CLPU_15c00060 [Gottschalkia purinilytica]|uniref:Sporulation membrane protein YtrI C-terminal domain-containing protein n=1 Tax=Gottschalkia purinilytica TaxID=1503 RepID=A0A0L0W7V3_GOTPU|nr:hypothetical protein [Gottschalkia purinilytica]KNF07512.1 hypothetical protein CLPU_15c00060 [Gottschalkia purinilytica]
MDRIKKTSFKLFFSITTGIIVGILLGVSISSALVSYRIDQYIRNIQYLESVIEDKEIRLKKLEESINSQKLILKDIKIVLIHKDEKNNKNDEIDKISLEKSIKEKYIKLLGKEVTTINVDIIDAIIDKRIMKIGEKEYKLKVSKIFLTDILEIWVETKLEE